MRNRRSGLLPIACPNQGRRAGGSGGRPGRASRQAGTDNPSTSPNAHCRCEGAAIGSWGGAHLGFRAPAGHPKVRDTGTSIAPFWPGCRCLGAGRLPAFVPGRVHACCKTRKSTASVRRRAKMGRERGRDLGGGGERGGTVLQITCETHRSVPRPSRGPSNWWCEWKRLDGRTPGRAARH